MPLMGEIFKILESGGESYMGGLNILWGGLDNHLETMFNFCKDLT